MLVVLLWWQDSKVVNYGRLRKCRLVNSIGWLYPVSQVSSNFRRYGDLFPFLLGNHPEMSVFRCVCVYMHVQRERAIFFCQHLFPPNLSNHKEMWCCLFFCLALIGFKQPPSWQNRWGLQDLFMFQVHNMMRMKRHTYIPWIYQSGQDATQCKVWIVFCFLWLLKKCLMRNPHPAFGGVKPTRKKTSLRWTHPVFNLKFKLPPFLGQKLSWL